MKMKSLLSLEIRKKTNLLSYIFLVLAGLTFTIEARYSASRQQGCKCVFGSPACFRPSKVKVSCLISSHKTKRVTNLALNLARLTNNMSEEEEANVKMSAAEAATDFKHWSLAKIHSQFDTSNTFVAVAKMRLSKGVVVGRFSEK